MFEALAEDKPDIQAQIDLRDAYLSLALTTANGGDPDAALFIDKAIKLSEQLAATTPNDSTSQLMLARSYVLRIDTRPIPVEERFAALQKALGVVEPIVQREPANTEALRSLGVIHQRIGDQSLRAAKVAGNGRLE